MARRVCFGEEKGSYWRGKIGEQGESGLAVSAFCRRAGISANSFYRWRRVLAERDRSPGSLDPTPSVPGPVGFFAPVSVRPSVDVPAGAEASSIELVLPSGHVLRVRPGFDSGTLARLLGLLGGSRC